MKTEKQNGPYKPDKDTYVAILILTGIFTLLCFLLPAKENPEPLFGIIYVNWERMFSLGVGIGGGGFISVVIAWLIDSANCRRDNREYHERYKAMFRAYWDSMDMLQIYAARQGEIIERKKSAHKFGEWLDVLNYINQKDTADTWAMREAVYRNIYKKVKVIQNNIELLQSQYLMVSSVGIQEREEMIDFLNEQYRLCEDIQVAYNEEEEIRYFSINAYTSGLVGKYRKFFPDTEIPEIYKYEKPKQ